MEHCKLPRAATTSQLKLVDSYSGFLIHKDPYQKPIPQRIGWTTTVTNLGFIAPPGYQTKEMACHLGQKNAPIYAKVAAGGKVTVQWNGGDASPFWPVGHKGPVLGRLSGRLGGE